MKITSKGLTLHEQAPAKQKPTLTGEKEMYLKLHQMVKGDSNQW
jgi:hypothetical protein